MLFFLIKRILFAIPAFLAVTFLVFVLIHHVPGSPFDDERGMPEAVYQRLNEHYGLDQSVGQQYCRYIGNVFKSDFGPSCKYNNWTVTELIQPKVAVSFELGIYAGLIALVFGISMGMLLARFQERKIGVLLDFLSVLGVCLPTFVIGPLLIYCFGIRLRWVNVAGWEGWSDKILPTLTLGLLSACNVARLTKRGLCDVLQKHYIMAARARGVNEWKIFFIHVLRNGLLPVVAYIGPMFAGIICGVIVTETIFQIPGLGRLLMQAISNRDGLLILGIVNLYTLAVIVCNTATDCVQAWLNPQIRLQ